MVNIFVVVWFNFMQTPRESSRSSPSLHHTRLINFLFENSFLLQLRSYDLAPRVLEQWQRMKAKVKSLRRLTGHDSSKQLVWRNAPKKVLALLQAYTTTARQTFQIMKIWKRIFKYRRNHEKSWEIMRNHEKSWFLFSWLLMKSTSRGAPRHCMWKHAQSVASSLYVAIHRIESNAPHIACHWQ